MWWYDKGIRRIELHIFGLICQQGDKIGYTCLDSWQYGFQSYSDANSVTYLPHKLQRHWMVLVYIEPNSFCFAYCSSKLVHETMVRMSFCQGCLSIVLGFSSANEQRRGAPTPYRESIAHVLFALSIDVASFDWEELYWDTHSVPVGSLHMSQGEGLLVWWLTSSRLIMTGGITKELEVS